MVRYETGNIQAAICMLPRMVNGHHHLEKTYVKIVEEQNLKKNHLNPRLHRPIRAAGAVYNGGQFMPQLLALVSAFQSSQLTQSQ